MLLALETGRLTPRRIGLDDDGQLLAKLGFRFERIARFTAGGPELRLFTLEA
jgi:hypothetical protein